MEPKLAVMLMPSCPPPTPGFFRRSCRKHKRLADRGVDLGRKGDVGSPMRCGQHADTETGLGRADRLTAGEVYSGGNQSCGESDSLISRAGWEQAGPTGDWGRHHPSPTNWSNSRPLGVVCGARLIPLLAVGPAPSSGNRGLGGMLKFLDRPKACGYSAYAPVLRVP